MLAKCTNPECANSFDDYRQGRLFRFHQSDPKGFAPVTARVNEFETSGHGI